MESTEALLVQQLKNGVDAAYKYLYDQHYQILCHVAAQYVKDDFLAETIVGDVIFHLWEVRDEIMNAINRLPDECRRVFNMSRFENRKYEEIAQELKISVNTVKYHIKHALALLYEDLGKYLTMAMMILIESMS